KNGVSFTNTHSAFPTITTANATVIATGHQLGDTGAFGNYLFTGYPAYDTRSFLRTTAGSCVPFLEQNEATGDVNFHVAGHNCFCETSLLAFARARGYATAAIGKVGPV